MVGASCSWLETVALQAGPLLTQIGIDDGIRGRDTGVLVVSAALYLAVARDRRPRQPRRIAWTGRVGERLLYELRVRVFSHLQRLSLDFFTEEKAGRLMTRMTSDIEALTQLFQDGPGQPGGAGPDLSSSPWCCSR